MIAPHIRKDRRGAFLLSLPIDAAGLPHADCVKNMISFIASSNGGVSGAAARRLCEKYDS